VGVWPFDQASPDTEFIDRIEGYMLKAIREAQLHTSWINPNEEYEAATSTFVRGLLSGKRSNPFLADFAGFAARIAHIGAITGLSQQLVKLTVPGVPDIYQGTELWDFSLVDPDNRRPVDFDRRHELLAEFTAKPASVDTAKELLASKEDGRIKLYVTRVALACRKEHPDLFQEGEYEPVDVEGAKADHAVAYARSYDGQRLVIVVPRLIGGLIDQPQDVPTGAIWRGTRLVLDSGDRGATYQNLFTGETVQAAMDGDRQLFQLEHVLDHFPVAMLQQMSDDSQREPGN
jgi:(1->4)-alpha-D-glucan 1-alpha-D-glucosylmutase